ncbi:unnamed protein product (macronuclear) [Paramecium tetraurelia]|uniref:Retinoblastoma-associated protein B-box domain-containing protein n=1 Tax=Paramecium tetraurelia TaxID=5888 RepID=A0DTJ1_PARTE|nr:uncharacterized protein GSPATT00020039001 [Paramecium tetraurelia]CAK86358.1 unnamed protein product [Paramecium tetraurelia]|eukprot:XP_001453755.1 hypothetical protein (macronuclear) [Paramecium tetraurelia strain d4-2]
MDTDSLQQQLQLIYQTFSLDQSTFKLMQEMTNNYILNNKTNDYIVIPRLALWLASKQQQIVAIDGSIVYGSGISLNSIINDCQNKGITNIDQLIDVAINMVTELKVDQTCQKTLTLLKHNNQILNMFYQKMEALLLHFKMNDQNILIKNITWLLFLITKKSLNLQDVVQSTCILISILTTILSQLLNIFTTTNKILSEIKKSAAGEDEQQLQIQQFLINQFKIQDLDLFSSINLQAKQQYAELIKQNIIKQLKSNSGFSIFMVSIINSNQYKLDQQYKHLLKSDEFDERLLIPDRQKNLTPKKLTPNLNTLKSNNIKQLAMQSKHDQNREQQITSQQQQQQNRYQKLLNYELDTKITLTTNLREIKLPQTVLMSPYAQQSIVATPMTEAMEMYNWMHEKQQPFKKLFKNGTLNVNQLLSQNPQLFQNFQNQGKHFDLIDKTFNEYIQYCQDSNLIDENKSKTNQYWTLYVLMLEKSNFQIDEQMLKSLICFCIECVYFVLNKQSQLLDQLMQKCEIQHYQLWKWLDFFLNQFDTKVPHQLKEHILDIEVKFVSYSIWSCDSQSELIKFLNEIHISRFQQNNNQMNRLFKRVLHYCAFQIQVICSNIKLQEQLQEYIWITIKYIISEKTDHLRYHSLDQIVLASIYAVTKLTGNQLKFQQIINAYELTNTWYSKQFIKKIVCNTYISNDSMGDIVSYYNQSFIPQIKSFMLQMSHEIKSNNVPQSPMNNKNPALNNKILDSPLRDILPRQQNFTTNLQSQHAGLMTPATQLLYAYQESPLLKQQVKQQALPVSKENVYNNSNINTKIDYSQETQDFILKKFEQLKNTKSKQINSKTSFSILQQGTPKILNSSRTNNSAMLQHNQTQNSQQSNEQNSTFCKLLNFEQQ